MNPLHDHQAAVLEAHARYSLAKRHLLELDAERERVANAMDSARAELDALATRMP